MGKQIRVYVLRVLTKNLNDLKIKILFANYF